MEEEDFSHDPFFEAFNSFKNNYNCAQPKINSLKSSLYNRDQLHEHNIVSPRIHQFWLGSKSLPEIYSACINANKNFIKNKKVEFKLYTDKDIDFILSFATPVQREIYKVIPSYDLACKKDLLMAIILHQEGGVGIDCSMYLNCVEDVFYRPLFSTRYRYYLRQKSRSTILHAIPCQFGFIACCPGSEITKYLLDGMRAFWLEDDHLRLSKSYTRKGFPSPDAKHGWMCQYYLNEAILNRIGNTTSIDTQIDICWDKYFIDIDCVPTAYAIKHLVTKNMNRDQFLNLILGKS